MRLRLIAPLLGGIVYAKAGYDAVFEMTLGVIGVDILLRFVTIERKVAMKWRQITVSETAAHHGREENIEGAHGEVEQIIRENDAQDAEKDGDYRLPATAQGGSPPENTPALSRPRRRVQLPAVLTLLSSRRLLSALWGTLVEGAIFQWPGISFAPANAGCFWVGLRRWWPHFPPPHPHRLSWARCWMAL